MQRPMQGDTAMSYAEILRVIGKYLEQINLSEIRILETDEGMILQGLVMKGEKAGDRMTYQITTDDIQALHGDAFAQRGKKI